MKPNIKVALSFDVEDWYMGMELKSHEMEGKERRLTFGLTKILSLLEEKNVKATFFILGMVCEMYPDEVKMIADAGHEIGSHGYSHTMVYKLKPASFRDEIKRTDDLLSDITGKKAVGFRAPYFSITKESLWALDVLIEEGYKYDASIYPGYNYRYGIPDSPHDIYKYPEKEIIEFPVSTMELFGRRIGIGGAYFRILPLFLTKRGIRKRGNVNKNTENNTDTVIYLHPWEFDPKHPKIKVAPLATLTHYINLGRTYPRLKRLLDTFSFTTCIDIIEEKCR
jgi:polysaccharide deacetylase family protein (PEP-CTERM system associated)